MQTVSVEQSVAMIPDGATLMIGGFMAVGTPERVIDEIVRQKKRDLTLIANDTAVPGRGVGKIIGAKLARKIIVSHIGLNPETQRQMMAGELEVELTPQGTLVECIRAGGHGLGGILTPTGLGTYSATSYPFAAATSLISPTRKRAKSMWCAPRSPNVPVPAIFLSSRQLKSRSGCR